MRFPIKQHALLAVFCFFFDTTSSNAMKPVQVIHVSDITSTEDFYTRFSREPVVVNGVYEDNKFLKTLTFETPEQNLQGRSLKVIAQGETEILPSKTFFTYLREVDFQSYILEHPFSETPFAGSIPHTPFLGNNWYDNAQLGSHGAEICLHIAKKGKVTYSHGTQGWLFVVTGVKEFTFLPAVIPDPTKENFGVVYDYNANRSDALQATIHPWQLLFIPPGWSHHVTTLEDSIGLSSYHINEYAIAASVNEIISDRIRWGIPSIFNREDDVLNEEKRIAEALQNGQVSDSGRLRVEQELESASSTLSCSETNTENPEAFTLRAMSANLFLAEEEREREGAVKWARLIQESGAQVVGLQEADDSEGAVRVPYRIGDTEASFSGDAETSPAFSLTSWAVARIKAGSNAVAGFVSRLSQATREIVYDAFGDWLTKKLTDAAGEMVTNSPTYFPNAGNPDVCDWPPSAAYLNATSTFAYTPALPAGH